MKGNTRRAALLAVCLSGTLVAQARYEITYVTSGTGLKYSTTFGPQTVPIGTTSNQAYATAGSSSWPTASVSGSNLIGARIDYVPDGPLRAPYIIVVERSEIKWNGTASGVSNGLNSPIQTNSVCYGERATLVHFPENLNSISLTPLATSITVTGSSGASATVSYGVIVYAPIVKKNTQLVYDSTGLGICKLGSKPQFEVYMPSYFRAPSPPAMLNAPVLSAYQWGLDTAYIKKGYQFLEDTVGFPPQTVKYACYVGDLETTDRQNAFIYAWFPRLHAQPFLNLDASFDVSFNSIPLGRMTHSTKIEVVPPSYSLVPMIIPSDTQVTGTLANPRLKSSATDTFLAQINAKTSTMWGGAPNYVNCFQFAQGFYKKNGSVLGTFQSDHYSLDTAYPYPTPFSGSAQEEYMGAQWYDTPEFGAPFSNRVVGDSLEAEWYFKFIGEYVPEWWAPNNGVPMQSVQWNWAAKAERIKQGEQLVLTPKPFYVGLEDVMDATYLDKTWISAIVSGYGYLEE